MTVVESGTLIIGLHQAIVELCEGVQYEIIIPPHLAYGEWGLEDYISGSVVLHADLKIHESWPQIDALKVALCDEEPTFEGNHVQRKCFYSFRLRNRRFFVTRRVREMLGRMYENPRSATENSGVVAQQPVPKIRP